MCIKEYIRTIFLSITQLKAKKLPAISLSSPVAILAPHPDDEVFGCGGLIAHLIAKGIMPHIILMSGGGKSHENCCNIEESCITEVRRNLALEVAAHLGVSETHVHHLDFQDGNIGDKPGSEMNRLKNLLSDLQPDTILVPHHGEGWPDHLATRQIGIDLAPKGAQVWEYCVWMWYYRQHGLDWKNARTLNMSATEHASKLNAIATYSNSCAPCGKPWIGVLPKLFMKANSKKHELFFRITK